MNQFSSGIGANAFVKSIVFDPRPGPLNSKWPGQFRQWRNPLCWYRKKGGTGQWADCLCASFTNGVYRFTVGGKTWEAIDNLDIPKNKDEGTLQYLEGLREDIRKTKDPWRRQEPVFDGS
jgi:hypothetical protein